MPGAVAWFVFLGCLYGALCAYGFQLADNWCLGLKSPRCFSVHGSFSSPNRRELDMPILCDLQWLLSKVLVYHCNYCSVCRLLSLTTIYRQFHLLVLCTCGIVCYNTQSVGPTKCLAHHLPFHNINSGFCVKKVKHSDSVWELGSKQEDK